MTGTIRWMGTAEVKFLPQEEGGEPFVPTGPRLVTGAKFVDDATESPTSWMPPDLDKPGHSVLFELIRLGPDDTWLAKVDFLDHAQVRPKLRVGAKFLVGKWDTVAVAEIRSLVQEDSQSPRDA